MANIAWDDPAQSWYQDDRPIIGGIHNAWDWLTGQDPTANATAPLNWNPTLNEINQVNQQNPFMDPTDSFNLSGITGTLNTVSQIGQGVIQGALSMTTLLLLIALINNKEEQ